MSFLQAAFLAGLLGVVVPIAIHLLNRRKAAVVRFPSLRFLQEIEHRRARISRVNEWIVLALRVAALALLAFALARPVLHSGSLGRGRATRVFVVDNSMSSAAVLGGSAALEHYRLVVKALVARMEPADRGAVIPLVADELHVAALTESKRDLEEAADAIEPTYGTTPIVEAVRRAIALLEDDDNPVREIILLSDLQASALRDAGDRPKLPDDIRLIALRSRAPSRANAAFSAVDVRQDRGGRQTVQARVRAFGTQETVVRIAFTVDGKPVEERAVRVAAQGDAIVRFRAPEQDSAGGREAVRARLEIRDDALALDNELELALAVSATRRVLIVRDAAAVRGARDPAFYLSRALVPRRANAVLEVRATSTARLRDLDLSPYHAVFLLEPAKLGARSGKVLADFVTAGGGLFVSTGPFEERNAFATLASAAGPLLPVVSGPVVRSERQPVHLGRWQDEHAIWAPLVGAQPPLRPDVPGFFAYREVTAARGARVLAEFESEAPALVERPAGFGTVVYFASTLSDAWGNLPLRFVFAPFAHSTLDHLAARTRRDQVHPVGAPLVLSYPRTGSASSGSIGADPASAPGFASSGTTTFVAAEARLPDGARRRVSADDVPSGDVVTLDLGTPQRPGLIAVREAYEGRVARRWIAVRTDIDESDLRPLPTDELERDMPGAEVVEFSHPGEALSGLVPLTVGSELKTALLVLLLGILLVEPLLANRTALREPATEATR